MGLGSFRATLFHILTAEEIWFERWTGVPPRPFPIDPAGIPLADIEQRLKSISGRRQELIDRERPDGWSRVVNYRDIRGNEHSRALDGLLLHVANHAVHHRAQALSYLKEFGRTAAVGIEYLFYKLAHPSVEQDAQTIEARRKNGIEMSTSPGVEPSWDPKVIARYFGYHDWAIARLLDLATPLPDAALDREFNMGPGTLRKTITHFHDVEPFWLGNWTGKGTTFQRTADGTSLAQLRETWMQTAKRRNQFIAGLDAAGASRVIAVSFGGPSMKFRVIESMLQVCVHGTHHRAQAINMLRHSGVEVPPFDLPIWLKEIGQ